MLTGINLLQLIVAGGLLNVWIFRKSKNTDYRGGTSKNLMQEFEAYGLSKKIYYLVGFLKVTSALMLIAAIWLPLFKTYAAGIITILMVGALFMHMSVKDPFKKFLPALAMLIMSSSLLLIQG